MNIDLLGQSPNIPNIEIAGGTTKNGRRRYTSGIVGLLRNVMFKKKSKRKNKSRDFHNQKANLFAKTVIRDAIIQGTGNLGFQTRVDHNVSGPPLISWSKLYIGPVEAPVWWCWVCCTFHSLNISEHNWRMFNITIHIPEAFAPHNRTCWAWSSFQSNYLARTWTGRWRF